MTIEEFENEQQGISIADEIAEIFGFDDKLSAETHFLLEF